MAGRTYAIGDVHGCAAELKTLLHRLALDQDSTVIFLGDYVDRGPRSREVIDTILDLGEIYRVIAIEGNHEWLFKRFLENPSDPSAASNFILNGGGATLASYSADGATYEVPASHREFLRNLKLFHLTETHLFVHAGVPPDFDFKFPVDPRTAHQLRWIREPFLSSTRHWPRVVVHGHTPVDEPEILPNRINLDTGCVFGKKLSALDLATGQVTSVARHEEAAPRFLTSTFQGVARARRFSGEVPVEIHAGEASHAFVTLNFNEFGLLVSPKPGEPAPVLTIGQRISGVIQPDAGSRFTFEGVLVRVDATGSTPCYGIKFEELREEG